MILIEIIDKKCKKQLSLLGDYWEGIEPLDSLLFTWGALICDCGNNVSVVEYEGLFFWKNT
jgi:hypothetical protein